MTTVRFEQSEQLWECLHSILKKKEFTPGAINKLRPRDTPEQQTLTFTVTYASVVEADKKREADAKAKAQHWVKKKEAAEMKKKEGADKMMKEVKQNIKKRKDESSKIKEQHHKKQKNVTSWELLADHGLNLVAAGDLENLLDFTCPTVTVLSTITDRSCMRLRTCSMGAQFTPKRRTRQLPQATAVKPRHCNASSASQTT
jgi:hypothetical protein